MPPTPEASREQKPRSRNALEPAMLAGGLLALGAIHALSFAPGPLPAWMLPFVQIFALAILAWNAMRASTAWRAALIGWLFGIANFSVGLYWLFISMHEYGDISAPLAALAVVLLGAFLALYTGLATGVASALGGRYLRHAASYQRQLLAACVWASCWAGAEWLRGTLFTGLPWLNIGYAHVEGMLAGWAPVTGVYGIAWLAAFAAAAIALFACAKDTQNDARSAIGVGLAIVAGLAGILLGHVSWSEPHGEAMMVRLTQGNVPQSQKFDAGMFMDAQMTYLQLASIEPREPGDSPKLIVMPETVVPIFQDNVSPDLWRHWVTVARTHSASVIMGVPIHDNTRGGPRYTNSAIGFDETTSVDTIITGRTPMRYDKNHLVPFGEFIPPGFRWFVDAMQIPLGDFDRGPARQRLFQIGDQIIAPDICYEDVFGEEIIRSVRDSDEHGAGATILLNMSNLGWFGDSWALRQHLQISRMRSLETARPMLRATNTGMTAAIAPNGVVRATLDPMKKGVLDVEVQGRKGFTPYVQTGNMPVLVLIAVFLALGLLRRRGLRNMPPEGDDTSAG